MKIKKISEKEFFGLKNRWDHLLTKNELTSVFLSFDWIKTWWKHNRDTKELFVLVAVKNDIIGIAPLMKSKGTLDKIEFIGTPEADCADFIIPNNRKVVLEKFYDHLSGLGCCIKLSEIPDNSSTIEITNEILRKNYQIHFCNHTSYINNKALAGIKKGYRKKLRRINKQGQVTFEKLSKQESLNLLGDFVRMHKENWAKKKQDGLFLKQTEVAWFKELIEKDLLKFWVLNLDKEPISIRGVLQWQGNTELFAHAMSEKHKHLAPGINSLMFLLQNCGEENMGFGRGDEYYKAPFVKAFGKNMCVQIYPNCLFHSIAIPINRLKEEIMNRPRLHRRLAQVRDQFESLRGKF